MTRKRKRSRLWIDLMLAAAALALIILLWLGNEMKNERETALESSATSQLENMTDERDSKNIRLYTGNPAGSPFAASTQLFTPQEYAAGVKNEPASFLGYARSVFDLPQPMVGKDAVFLLTYTAVSENRCVKIAINFYSEGTRVCQLTDYIGVQAAQRTFSIRFSGRADQLEFTPLGDYDGIQIGEVSLAPLEGNEAASVGLYNLDKQVQTELLAESPSGENTTFEQVVSDGDYLYIGKRDRLDVAELLEDGTLHTVGSVSGLGYIRRMALTQDRKAIAVVSREYGAFLIDLSNPALPVVASAIDTLELASGVWIEGEYAFFANRYGGIEIYDIQDIARPQFVSVAKSSQSLERIDAAVYGGYLYTSGWDHKKIEIFDLTDLSNPRSVGEVSVLGTPYGICASNGMLYVATGFHDVENAFETPDDAGYGCGNGLAIYSLEDPAHPEWKSTSLLDGRYYYVGMDYWDVSVEGNTAFVSALYSGLYVYDVSNPGAPVRIAHAEIPVALSSADAAAVKDETQVFPYAKDESRCPVTSAAYYKNKVFLTGWNSNVYSFALQKHPVDATEEPPQTTLSASGERDSIVETLDLSKQGYAVSVIGSTRQTYAVVEYDGVFYVAGSDGIRWYDAKWKQLGWLETYYAVKDMKLSGSLLVTAEGLNGLGVYKIRYSEPHLLACYLPQDNYASVAASAQVAVSPDGKFAVLHCRMHLFKMIDISSPETPVEVENVFVGSTYYRHFCMRYYNKTEVLLSHSQGICVFDFTGENKGDYTAANIPDSQYFDFRDTFAVTDDNRVIAILDRGYKILTIENGAVTSASDVITLEGDVFLRGYPVIRGDLLVVTDVVTGNVVIADLSDLEQPKLKATFTLSGSVDPALITKSGKILIPARYDGLIVLTPLKNK